MYLETRRRSKMGNIPTSYKGILYHSKKEVEYAMFLDSELQAGRISRWERQVPIELRVNGQLVSTYKMDFVVYDNNGNEKWVEVKGFETREWRLRWKLLDALFQDQDKEVVK